MPKQNKNTNVSFQPLTFNEKLCNGCKLCVEVCQLDILIPNLIKGKPPQIMYPDECWYEGSCVMVCPIPGAIILNNIPENNVSWKRKESGDIHRLINLNNK